MENSPHAQNQRAKDTRHLFVSRKKINHRYGEVFCVETSCLRVRALCVLNKCDSMCMRAWVCVVGRRVCVRLNLWLYLCVRATVCRSMTLCVCL